MKSSVQESKVSNDKPQYRVRLAVDFSTGQEAVLTFSLPSKAAEVGKALAATKVFEQVEVETPTGNVFWATYSQEFAHSDVSRATRSMIHKYGWR
jgi:hypothetical protein